ncbi:MAG: HD domain-containing protein, partial [Desulfovibrio sp.]|uniref:HD domain-containing protein n=1 Tax=Desulfovibrio sp. TaxID=885 RepID=UPI00135EC81D
MPTLIARAAAFAAEAHAAVGQVRKYTGEPYVEHPRAVARLVADAGGDDAMVAAAWLHDVVEDTRVSLDEIRGQFGDAVADRGWWG